jgi:2-oxoglutarate/2-oxoacid ferredoxin oxidoreductase subunit alpha
MGIDFNFMIGGEAGQGIQSMSFVLGKVMMRGGYEVFVDQDFESRIRGGHSFSRIRVADREIHAMSEKVDILIALHSETIDVHREDMRRGGLTIYDGEKVKIDKAKNDNALGMPLERLAVEKTGNRLTSNTVATGAALGLIGYDFDLLKGVLREEFGRHGEKTVENNITAAQAGFDHARQEHGKKATHQIRPIAPSRKIMLTGHEAVSLGAMAAGCKFVAGYPMTPTTSILEYIADKGRTFNILVIQAEDEISAMNMVIGAAYTGVRAMTATSGGGFCLMTEGLSLAAMTETPVVVVLGQRPGPAIGLPTRTEQSDLEFALYGGHGGFRRPVLAPAGTADAFWLTVKAFNLAERYQTPVIIVTDHDLADSYNSVERFDLSQVKIDRGSLLSDEEAQKFTDYKRHLITESGISPRGLPGQSKSLVVTDSDEHSEEGHIIEDAETRARMVMKRMRKLEGLKRDLGRPRIYTKPDAEFTLVGWGSTYGAIKEAIDLLEADGIKANMLHLNELWPFPIDAVMSVVADSAKTIVIENNATGQLARLMRAETGIKAHRSILKFDGRPFSPQYIVDALKKEVS